VVEVLSVGPVPDRTGTHRARPRLPVGIFVVVFVLGLAHALIYAVVLPPWAIDDEPQHVDYALHLANDRTLPDLDGEIDPAIVRSMFANDRWSAYDLGPTPPRSTTALGLGSKSYLAYHPPLPYLGMAAVVSGPLGQIDDVALIALRALAAVAFGLACAGTALIAARVTAGIGRPVARWTPAVRRAALGAGVAMAVLPVLADAGGRVNTDVLGLLAVVGTLLVMLRWLDDPSRSRALAIGGALAVSAMTRETAVVLVVPTIALLIVARRERIVGAGLLIRLLAPPVAAVALWGVTLWARTGQVIGSQAFIDHFGAPFAGLGPGESLGGLANTWLLPYGTWNVPSLVVLIAGAGVAVGLVAAARSGLAGITAVAVTMAAVGLVVFAVGAASGLTTVTARLMLPAFPAVIAVAAAGWARRSRWTGTLSWMLATVAFGAWFVVGDLLPRYVGAG
jgi:hypothetical protein